MCVQRDLRSAQMFSIGAKSGDKDGQSRTLTLQKITHFQRARENSGFHIGC